MKQKYILSATYLLLILTMCVFTVNAQDTGASLPEILDAVQKNVDFLKEHIVDLISEEEIIAEEFNDKGKVKKTTNIISEYRIFPELTNSTSGCHAVYEIIESLLPAGILREERELLSAKENNKTQRLDKYEFTEQFWAKGSSYIELFFLFDKQNEKCFDYELKGVRRINNRNVYEIGIKQKESDAGTKQTSENENISWDIKFAGFALIDTGTREIVQLNRDKFGININTRRPGKSPIAGMFPYVTIRYFLFTQYEYGKVKIDDQYLTLPVAKTFKLFRINEQLHASYKYRYRNHKVFTVDTKISFDPIEESSMEEGNAE